MQTTQLTRQTTRLMLVMFMTLFTYALIPVGSVEAGRTDPVGTSYPSQKIVFQDPVSGRAVWRMTVDGTNQGALNTTRDASGMEADQFSPNGTRICYSKKNHPSKPDGYYVMDIITGVEKYVGPGSNSWGICTFSKTSNELFYGFFRTGTTASTTWEEVRAVNLATYSTRVLNRFYGAFGGPCMSINSDGSYLELCFRVPTGDPADVSDDPVYHVIISTSNGAEHPNWRYDPATPDEYNAGDHSYWHPTNPRIIRTGRNEVNAIWNIDTLATESTPTVEGYRSVLPTSHACWTADAQIFYSGSPAHPDCYPLDTGRGSDTRVLYDGPSANPYLYFTAIRNVAERGMYPSGSTDVLALHYTYNNAVNGDIRYTHPHPLFSRDGRYVLFTSPVTNVNRGIPSGGVGDSPYKVDLFIIPLDSTTPPPTTCTNLQTSSASIPTGYGASYNPLTTTKEYLIQASCTTGTQATVTVGNGTPTTYVYNKGYYYSGTTWTPYTLSCASGALIGGAWCPGRATAVIPLPQNPQNVIAYTCQYTNSTWKCGCRDATCSTPYWQLQRVQR